MRLDSPFAVSTPLNLPDPACPHCGVEDDGFLAEQARLVAELAPRFEATGLRAPSAKATR
jgi:hypothetical protein